MVDLVDRQTRVLDRLVERLAALLHQVSGQLIELRSAELDVEVLGTVGGRGDEGEVDRGLLDRRQLDLGLLRGLLQSLGRHLVG